MKFTSRTTILAVGTVAALAGGAAVGLPALADNDSPAAPTWKPADIRVAAFDPDAVRSAGPGGAPIGIPLPPSPTEGNPTPVAAQGGLVEVKGDSPDLPGLSQAAPTAGVDVVRAVQLPRDEADKAYDAPGVSFRVIYRADVKTAKGPQTVEVFEPAGGLQGRTFEAPGNAETVDGVDLYSAESGPGVSFATTVVQNGRFAVVAGPGTSASRLAILRSLGFAK